MNDDDDYLWPNEQEYVEQLECERHMFAWALERFASDGARAAAIERCPSEPRGTPYRWMIFHQDAWKWAMDRIYGRENFYWIERPGIHRQPPEYWDELKRYEDSK